MSLERNIWGFAGRRGIKLGDLLRPEDSSSEKMICASLITYSPCSSVCDLAPRERANFFVI